jgi:hypothetical protein
MVLNDLTSVSAEISVKSRACLLQDHRLSLNFAENSVDLSHVIVGYSPLLSTVTLPATEMIIFAAAELD